MGRSVIQRFTPIVTLVAACWLVFLLNQLVWGGQLNRYGILPRHVTGLPGILCAPFLHGSLPHLLANTVPLLIFGIVLCARSPAEFSTVAGFGTLLAGGLTWVFARSAIHIGASGLIFCFFGYLASLAYFQRTLSTLLLSAACIIGYGGILKGLVPSSTPISWEGHLAGLVAGIVLASLAPKPRRQPKAHAGR
jgi:membrane associated rhomboid family serine protease